MNEYILEQCESINNINAYRSHVDDLASERKRRIGTAWRMEESKGTVTTRIQSVNEE